MFDKQKIDATFIFFLFLYLLNIYLKFNGLIILCSYPNYLNIQMI